jgi:cbb3-type cytochrome oxidase maturation protein
MKRRPRVDILLLLIPLSVVLVLLIGAGFWWSVASGQFDDLEGPAHRILADDDSAGLCASRPEPAANTRTGMGTLTSIKLPAGGDG